MSSLWRAAFSADWSNILIRVLSTTVVEAGKSSTFFLTFNSHSRNYFANVYRSAKLFRTSPLPVPPENQTACLFWERSLSDAKNVVLCFMAHPDDAEILCGGVLIRLSQLGWAVHIATVAAGDCGSETLPPHEIAAIRKNEGVAAAQLIGGTYHTLAEPDVNVVFDKPTNRKAIDLFRQLSPRIVITHPREDYMLDHEQTHLLARSAAFSFPIPNASETPLAAEASIPHLYYADPIEGLHPYTGELVTPTVTIDVSEVIETKAEMLACHASQREWLRAHHGMDEYLEAMKRHSALRGSLIGTPYAESFRQHRGHAFPQNDLLAELLP